MTARNLWRQPADGPATPGVLALNYAVAIVLLAGLLTLAFHQLAYGWNWAAVGEYRAKFVQGWLTTLGVSSAALLGSLLLGGLLALAGRSAFLPLRCGTRVVVEVIRGTPLLVQLLIFFYVVAEAVGMRDRYLAGVLTLSLFAGAYISEILRGGVDAIGRTQLESARAVGFTRAQTFRYVVAPQALRQTLPPLAGQFASLVKDSSLLSIIAVNEFTLQAQEVNSFTYSTLESYLPLAAGYLLLTFPISLATRWLELRSHYET